MALATIQKVIDTQIPAMEVVRLAATDTNTYKSKKFIYVEAGIGFIDQDLDDTISVCNSDNSALDGTTDTVRINSSGLAGDIIVLFLWGKKR